MLCCYHGQIITQKQVKLAVLNKEFQSHSYHIVLLGYIGRYGNCQGQTSTVTAPKPDMGNDLCLLFLRLQLPVQATARGGGGGGILSSWCPRLVAWDENWIHCILAKADRKPGFSYVYYAWDQSKRVFFGMLHFANHSTTDIAYPYFLLQLTRAIYPLRQCFWKAGSWFPKGPQADFQGVVSCLCYQWSCPPPPEFLWRLHCLCYKLWQPAPRNISREMDSMMLYYSPNFQGALAILQG